ncbi:MAG: metal ABC transporter solute-binding protein, Zn/Mn family [Eubacteriales bacterium]
MIRKLIFKLPAVAAVLFFAAFVVSCQDAGDNAGLPKIAVSIVPQATFVKEVCADGFEVVTLIPPGYSPENYEPTTDVIAALEDSAIYFTVGVPAEDSGILPDISEKVKVVALEDEVAKVYPDITIDGVGRDPHIWLSPKRVKVMVSAIARELGEFDPDNAEKYVANANAYIEKLDALDAYLAETFGALENKSFVIFHPALGYLADDYGLTMYALEEEGKEATAAHLQKVIDIAKVQGIKTVFYQSEIDSRQAQAFADELGGEAVMLEPLAADYIPNLEKTARLLAEAMK